MLGKLLKYEIMATGRTFLPLYGVLLTFALINKTFSLASYRQLPYVISMITYFTILVGMFVMTVVVMIQRFYKNLLSDEGYLMFTIPTKPWQHITCKLLTSILWIIVSGIAAVISIFIISSDNIFSTISIQALFDAITEYFRTYGTSSLLLILEFVILSFVILSSGILIIYASMTLGQLFNQHRVLASLGAFLVLNTATQILMSLFGEVGVKSEFTRYEAAIDRIDFAFSLQNMMVWYTIIFFGLISAGYFAIANYILSRRLNLE